MLAWLKLFFLSPSDFAKLRSVPEAKVITFRLQGITVS
jgi:hypothetical protein